MQLNVWNLSFFPFRIYSQTTGGKFTGLKLGIYKSRYIPAIFTVIQSVKKIKVEFVMFQKNLLSAHRTSSDLRCIYIVCVTEDSLSDRMSLDLSWISETVCKFAKENTVHKPVYYCLSAIIYPLHLCNSHLHM